MLVGWELVIRDRDFLFFLVYRIFIFLRRNDVNYLRISTLSFEELGFKLEGIIVINSVYIFFLLVKNK